MHRLGLDHRRLLLVDAAVDAARPAFHIGLWPAHGGRSMVSPVAQLTTRLAYGATQLSRVVWYVGHGEIMRRLSRAAREREASARPKPQTDRPVPERRQLFADMTKLFQQDLANVEAGIYPL